MIDWEIRKNFTYTIQQLLRDGREMGNYYGSGGEWVECSQVDGEREA
jgi:hypothetical protein